MDRANVNRIILVIIGLILCGVGVALMLSSDLGVDPNSVFVTGISNQLNISYGVSSLIINGIILSSVFIIDKKYVNISSILGIFLIGFTVDLVNVLIDYTQINLTGHILIQISLVLVGLYIMCYGVVMYIDQDLGIAAFDSISELISKKLKLEFRYVRITIDTTLMCIGWILGGSLGVGTVIAALFTGPTITFIRNLKSKKLEQN